MEVVGETAELRGSFRFVPVRSGSFRFVPVRSGSFRFVPVRSGSFRFVPVRSGSFRFVPPKPRKLDRNFVYCASEILTTGRRKIENFFLGTGTNRNEPERTVISDNQNFW
jgi:hypothetical protein